VLWQVSLGPVWTGSGSGLREGVEALPPSVTSLALLPDLVSVEREGGGAGGAWRLRLWPAPLGVARRSAPAVLELCAAFDRPGMPCGLEGPVQLCIEPLAEAGPGALSACLGQCAELANRLRSDGTSGGVELTLVVRGSASDGGAADGGGGFLSHVLAAVLPAAAPHVRALRLLVASGSFPAGCSRHLTAPGLAFPLLEHLELGSGPARPGQAKCKPSMEAADVAALARLVAPRLRRVGLLRPISIGSILGAGSGRGAVTALAMGLARPVDDAGCPAGLKLFVGVRRWGYVDDAELELALERAGRGWVQLA
jgi:hypothetical protein